MLRPGRLHDLARDHKAAQVLYHALGGKQTHIVIATRWIRRWFTYKGAEYELFSSEILVKDEWNRLHMMILRVIDDLEILDMISEDPLGDIWDFHYQGKACFGSASSTVVVYLTSAKLPGGKAVCRFGFPLIPDDIMRKSDYENEARAVLNTLRNRLGKFSLELAEEKTRILPIGRFKGTKEDFDFLGFTFYNTTTRGGKYRLGIRSSKKKLKAKRQVAKEWLRTRLTKPAAETMKLLASIIRGHCNYYGINGNFRAIQNFWKYLQYATYRMLNRRDQKGRLKYLKFLRIWNYYIPEPHLTKDIWNWKPKVS